MKGRNEVDRLKRSLDTTFRRVEGIGDDLELKSDFARYLCILVSGYVENSVVELLLAHCRRQSAPSVQRYVESNLQRFTNVNREKLLQLLGSFDGDWRVNAEQFIVEERDAALNSVVAVRNQIAHGGSASISFVRIKDYYASIQQIVEFLKELLDPE